MTNTESPFIECGNCRAKFSWVFVDSISEGDIYECEFCNNIIIKRYKQEDVMEYDN